MTRANCRRVLYKWSQSFGKILVFICILETKMLQKNASYAWSTISLSLFDGKYQNLQLSLTHFRDSSYHSKNILKNQILYIQYVGQGHGVQFSP